MALQQEKVVLLVGGNNFYQIFISSVKYNFGGIIIFILVMILWVREKNNDLKWIFIEEFSTTSVTAGKHWDIFQLHSLPA